LSGCSSTKHQHDDPWSASSVFYHGQLLDTANHFLVSVWCGLRETGGGA
jgi:hypothetical protein